MTSPTSRHLISVRTGRPPRRTIPRSPRSTACGSAAATARSASRSRPSTAPGSAGGSSSRTHRQWQSRSTTTCRPPCCSGSTRPARKVRSCLSRWPPRRWLWQGMAPAASMVCRSSRSRARPRTSDQLPAPSAHRTAVRPGRSYLGRSTGAAVDAAQRVVNACAELELALAQLSQVELQRLGSTPQVDWRVQLKQGADVARDIKAGVDLVKAINDLFSS